MTTMTTMLHGRPVMVNVMPANFEADRQAKMNALFHTLDGTKPAGTPERRSLNM